MPEIGQALGRAAPLRTHPGQQGVQLSAPEAVLILQEPSERSSDGRRFPENKKQFEKKKKRLQQELTDFTPSFSSLLTKVCSMSGLIAFLMLLFRFRTLEVTLFLSGAASGFLSLGFFSEKLLESVKKKQKKQPTTHKPQRPGFIIVEKQPEASCASAMQATCQSSQVRGKNVTRVAMAEETSEMEEHGRADVGGGAG